MADTTTTTSATSPELIARIDAHRTEWRRFDDDRYEESCERTLAALEAVLAFKPTSLADVQAIATHRPRHVDATWRGWRPLSH